MGRKNKKTKSVGNGEGSLYYSEALEALIYQYTVNGKRKTMKQKKKETVKEFKMRVTKVKNDLNTNTYIDKSKETIITLARQYIENKHEDGTTNDRSYRSDLDTLNQIEKTCYEFCNIPIQKVTIVHIEKAKKNIKKYSNSVINKIWRLLGKAFSMACSQSRKILTYNLMEDINLKKPISEKKTKKVKSLKKDEFEKLNSILDNEERNHPYRNIVKMQCLTGMRIGEVLARSRNDFDEETNKFNVHNTLTQDDKRQVILGEHTKTYNKKTQIDEGQRYLPLDKTIFLGVIEIIKGQCTKKVRNMYNLLFWDYEDNTFITPSEVNAWLNRINVKYKITNENLSTHRLRHTAITYWKTIGIPLDVIQHLAGHVEGSSVTEDVYIDITEEYVCNELEKIG